MKCKNCGHKIEYNEQGNLSHWTEYGIECFAVECECTNPEPIKTAGGKG